MTKSIRTALASLLHPPGTVEGRQFIFRRSERTQKGGFSLIEVAMAIGVISFAFVSILGLVPMGMSDFRNSIDTSVGAEISQRLVNEAQETDFNTLLAAAQKTSYFDVDGSKLPSATGAIYWAQTHVTPSTNLPGYSTANIVNQNIATVVVQIANNPAGSQLATDATTNLWKVQPGISMKTFSTVIAGYYSSTAAAPGP